MPPRHATIAAAIEAAVPGPPAIKPLDQSETHILPHESRAYSTEAAEITCTAAMAGAAAATTVVTSNIHVASPPREEPSRHTPSERLVRSAKPGNATTKLPTTPNRRVGMNTCDPFAPSLYFHTNGHAVAFLPPPMDCVALSGNTLSTLVPYGAAAPIGCADPAENMPPKGSPTGSSTKCADLSGNRPSIPSPPYNPPPSINCAALSGNTPSIPSPYRASSSMSRVAIATPPTRAKPSRTTAQAPAAS